MEGGDIFVNGAKVIMADVITSNGVVHVIDKWVSSPPQPMSFYSDAENLSVLNPNNTDDTPNTADATQSAAFSSATRVNDVPFTSGMATMTGSMTSMPTSSSTSAPSGRNAANTLRGNIAVGAVMGAAFLFAFAIVAWIW